MSSIQRDLRKTKELHFLKKVKDYEQQVKIKNRIK
jgi:hypothetical protein